MGRDSGVCVGVCVEVFNHVGGEQGDLASSELACTNKGNACIWYSSLCTVHTHTCTDAHTIQIDIHNYYLLSVFFQCKSAGSTGAHHNMLLLN